MEEAEDSYEFTSKPKPKKVGSKAASVQKLARKVNILNKTGRSESKFNTSVRGGAVREKLFCKSDIPREALTEQFEILLSPTPSQIITKLSNPWVPADGQSTENSGRDGIQTKVSDRGKKKSKSFYKDAGHSGFSTPDGRRSRSKRYADDDSAVEDTDSEGKCKKRQSKSGKVRKQDDEDMDVIIDSDGIQVNLKRTPSGHFIDGSGKQIKLKRSPSGRLVTEDGKHVTLQRKPSQAKGKFYWKTADGKFVDADGNEGHFSKSPCGRFINEEGRKGRFKRASDGSFFFQYEKDKFPRLSEVDSKTSTVSRERFTKTASGRFVDHDGNETTYRRTPLGSFNQVTGPFHRTKSGRFVDADGKEGKYRLTPDGRYVDEFGNEVSEEEVLRFYREGDMSSFKPRSFSLANSLYSLSSEPTVPPKRKHSKPHIRSLDKVGEIGPVPFEDRKMSVSFPKKKIRAATKDQPTDGGPQMLRADEIELFCTGSSESNLSDARSDSILFQIDLEPPPEKKKKKKKKRGMLARLKGLNKRLPSIFLKTRYIKFKGWDVGVFAKPEETVNLPTLVDNADSLLKFTSRQKMSFVYDEAEATLVHGDTRQQAIKYLAQYGISELLEFVLFNLVKEKPANPYDFMIELMRSISRLMCLRDQSFERIEERQLWATQTDVMNQKSMYLPGLTPMASLVAVDVHRDVSLFPSPKPSGQRLSPVLSTKRSGAAKRVQSPSLED